MKPLLGLILLFGLLYGGYTFYQSKSQGGGSQSNRGVSSLTITQTGNKLDDFAQVLGASISKTFENGKELLSSATSGKSEPIINELVNKTTDTLKDLPRKEAEKIKYEFCRGIVEEYENKSTNN